MRRTWNFFKQLFKKSVNPICPQCGKDSLVLYTPPKDGLVGTIEGYKLLGTPEYVDWKRSHLYCSNAMSNCTFVKNII